MTAPTDERLAELAEAVERAEDAYLLALSDRALAEGGEPIPLDQVRAQLGIPE